MNFGAEIPTDAPGITEIISSVLKSPYASVLAGEFAWVGVALFSNLMRLI